MTTLPARWRNTNDALRKPVSVAGLAGAPRTRRAPLARLRPSRAVGRGLGARRRGSRRRNRGRGAATGPNCSAPTGTPGRRGQSPGHARCHGAGGPASSGTAGGFGAARRAAAPARTVSDRPERGTVVRVRRVESPARRTAAGGTRAATSRGSTTRARRRVAARAGGARFVGQLGVQRWRRSTLGGFGGAHHDPVSRRVLHQMRGVARRDHAEIAGGLGQRRCGLGLEHVALECFLLLQQRLIGLACIAQLVGAFGGIGRQPQRDAESQAQVPRSPAPRTAPGRPARGGSARSTPA